MEKMTIKEATYKWVNEFNSYPRSMIETLMDADPNSWEEVTPPGRNDRVYCHSENEYGYIRAILDPDDEEEETDDYNDEEKAYEIELDNGKTIRAKAEDFDIPNYGYLPMWGTLWSFDDSSDIDWLSNHLQEMADCGFRVYYHEEWGYFFGIDGAGYSFYDEHWIPLYKARGLYWHTEEDDTKEE